MNPVIDVAIEAEEWSALRSPEALASAALGAAIEAGAVSLAAGAEVSIVLCDDAFIADLNRRWREIDKPTNVLAFPAGGDPATAAVLGDIVIAFETAAREAKEAGISLNDHVAHLLVHGFLHLVGYDHVDDVEAEEMERLEVRTLALLGIADPYDGGGVMLAAGQR
jgi:probable rRNA maturation factor